jgi:hypothetical protein
MGYVRETPEDIAVRARKIGLAMFFVCICLIAIACGGSSANVGDSSATGDSQDLEAIYTRIEDALDDAYVESGKPTVNWDNLETVKDRAFKALTSDPASTPAGTSWSVSVMPDHIVVFVNLHGAEKTGEWRP